MCVIHQDLEQWGVASACVRRQIMSVANQNLFGRRPRQPVYMSASQAARTIGVGDDDLLRALSLMGLDKDHASSSTSNTKLIEAVNQLTEVTTIMTASLLLSRKQGNQQQHDKLNKLLENWLDITLCQQEPSSSSSSDAPQQ